MGAVNDLGDVQDSDGFRTAAAAFGQLPAARRRYWLTKFLRELLAQNLMHGNAAARPLEVKPPLRIMAGYAGGDR